MAIRILQTSDLHIGKRLYEKELAEDQQLFFEWLTNIIESEKIDSLIIPGDIFDVANPSSESRKMYYELLVRLSRLKCKVIIAGGNHDSPSMLEAPGELLRELDIHVTGGLPDDPGEMLTLVKEADGYPGLVIASVPFIRDADLRRHAPEESYEDRLESIRAGIIRIYSDIAVRCEKLYPGIPAIAMGHFYVLGGTLSESERDIQVGNLAAIEAGKLPSYFSHYALGHLHNPQSPDGARKIHYSGSPVKLSFSERDNTNRVLIYTLEKGKTTVTSVPVPPARNLIKLTGTVSAIKEELNRLTPGNRLLTTLIELDATEENEDPAKRSELETLVNEFSMETMEIIKSRIRFLNKTSGTADIYDAGTSIEELEPSEVFERKMENDNLDENTVIMLKEAFAELLEEVWQKQNE
ncbi:MAG: exonuclease SbcCD subunit D C-terminal domain-containing protein [Bacteroidales bacterium]|nr:exonuclease SbcCD subunit D C-terminal domain-containing protein [Bacteroidales bacterium]